MNDKSPDYIPRTEVEAMIEAACGRMKEDTSIKSSKARNEALVILSFMGLVVGILSFLGIDSFIQTSVRNKVDTEVKADILAHNEDLERLKSDTESLLSELREASSGQIHLVETEGSTSPITSLQSPGILTLPDSIPDHATGVIVKIQMKTSGQERVSFVPSNSNGEFNAPDRHNELNGFTVYSYTATGTEQWSNSSLVLCPVHKGQIDYQILHQNNSEDTRQRSAFVSFVAWF